MGYWRIPLVCAVQLKDISAHYLNAVLDKLSCLHASFYVETDVYFYFSLLVSEFDYWYLGCEEHKKKLGMLNDMFIVDLVI